MHEASILSSFFFIYITLRGITMSFMLRYMLIYITLHGMDKRS